MKYDEPDADEARESFTTNDEEGFRLTDIQIEQITDSLRAGRPLPPHLFPHIFEAPKEYELAYRAKARRADVLAETMSVPLQAVRTYGETTDGWSNMLVLGDNLQVLRTLLRLKSEGLLRSADGTDGVRLCYIDPPFATRREFQGARAAPAYEDRVAGAEFVEFLRRRLILIHDLLSRDGSLYVHLDTRKVHYIKVVLDEIFGEHNFRSEVIWKRTSAHSSAKRYGPVHDVLLYYTKSDTYIWNPQHTPLREEYLDTFFDQRDSDGRRWKRGDLTGAGIRRGATGEVWRGLDVTAKGRHWAYPPSELDRLDKAGRIHWPKKEGGMPRLKQYPEDVAGVPLQDIWTDIPPMHNLSQERLGYPTQKPKALLKRIIEASTNPGDLVLDCFAGSGTTMLAAQESSDGPRRWIGVDSSKLAVYIAQAALLRSSGKGRPEEPFTLFNAGLYDYQSLRDLPWDSYRDFVLQLFQCRPHAEVVGGVSFDGFLGDHRVLVYNFGEHPEGKIGQGFVEDIRTVCGDRLGTRCFVIAPAVTVEPYEDYLDIEGTRFFFLRIPYSIIAELHKRAFSELRQPSSADLLNATIDSVGFDFVTPPRVECAYRRTQSAFEVQISHFESEAYAASHSEENIAHLAMVMVDCNYNDDIFDLDAVYFAEELDSASWTVRLPLADVGEKVMLVYVDVFGNEHREVRAASDFKESGRKRSTQPAKQPARPGQRSTRRKTTSAKTAKGASSKTSRAAKSRASSTKPVSARRKPSKNTPKKRSGRRSQ